MSKSVARLVVYRVKPGKEAEFLPILKMHAPALTKLGLVTDAGVKAWQAKDIRTKKTAFVELFQWKDGDSAEVAHKAPEVMRVWEPMTPLLDGLELYDLDGVE
jgi:hypothetical protein